MPAMWTYSAEETGVRYLHAAVEIDKEEDGQENDEGEDEEGRVEYEPSRSEGALEAHPAQKVLISPTYHPVPTSSKQQA